MPGATYCRGCEALWLSSAADQIVQTTRSCLRCGSENLQRVVVDEELRIIDVSGTAFDDEENPADDSPAD
jgi:hypothetical protein